MSNLPQLTASTYTSPGTGGYVTPGYARQFEGPRLPSMGMRDVTDRAVARTQQVKAFDEYAKQAEAYRQSNPVGGGGISAYGYQGTTGLAQHKGSGPYGLQPELWDALSKANIAMQQAGLGAFGITDGWRSYEAQVDVKKRKPNLAATPGTSIHGLGLAADLKLTKAQAEWLRKNGAQFGLYAPVYNKENWHWQLIPSYYTRGW